MQQYNEYINQRLKDLETVKTHLPEMSAILDIAISATKDTYKLAPFATQVKSKLEEILGRELSWVESDVFTQLFMAHAGQSLANVFDEMDYNTITDENTVQQLTEKLTDRFAEMLGVTEGTDAIKEVASGIVSKVLALI